VWPDAWKDDGAPAGRRNGLTLLEVLMVMAILAMLLSLVIGLGRHADAAGKRGRALADMAVWRQALARWHLEFGEYPCVPEDTGTVSNLLAVSVETPSTNLVFVETQNAVWRMHDPWGALYRYSGSNQTCRIWSLGPDGRPSADDVRED